MIIQIDTREQKPWSFAKYDGIEGEFFEKLDSGDYSLYNSNVIIIDRKASVLELSTNLGKDYQRFCREFDRMSKYKYKIVLCEFPIEDVIDFPKTANIPPYKLKYIRMNGSFMLKRINEIEHKYDIQFIFSKNREEAEETALELLKNA
jgi:hypothetical protein